MISHFWTCEIEDDPKMVAPLPYLNFLRYFKRKNPRYGLRRLLQEAPAHWDSLTDRQKSLFKQQPILKHLAKKRKFFRRTLKSSRCNRLRGATYVQ